MSEAAEVTQTAATASSGQGLSIVIADRGWVWVGKVSANAEAAMLAGSMVVIEDARCVRRWGTTEGLGQLARKGPQPNTKLETPTTVKVAGKAVIAILPCEPSAWTA